MEKWLWNVILVVAEEDKCLKTNGIEQSLKKSPKKEKYGAKICWQEMEFDGLTFWMPYAPYNEIEEIDLTFFLQN